MRYKLNILSGAALCLSLAMMTAGCSIMDDDPACPSAQGGDAGNAYISLRFAMPSAPLTRANPDGGETGDGQEAGQDDWNENTITSAVAFLFDGSLGVNADASTHVTPVSFSSLTIEDDDPALGVDRVYRTETRQVDNLDNGTYNLIVVANPADVQSLMAMTTLGQVQSCIVSQAWTESGGTYSNFLMASADDVPEADRLVLNSNSEDNPATVTVDVERVAARVDYNSKEQGYECTDPEYVGATVTITGAYIVNRFTAGSYLLKRVAQTVGGAVAYLGKETPDAGIQTNYVIDPWTASKNESNAVLTTTPFNVNGTSVNAEGLYADGTYFETRSTDPQWWSENITAGIDVPAGGGYKRIGYTLENTTSAENTSTAYNTGIVFKAQFSPVGLTGYSSGQTFFKYDKTLYASLSSLVGQINGQADFGAYVSQSVSASSTLEDIKTFAGRLVDDPAGYKDFLLSLTDANGFLGWADYLSQKLGYTETAGGPKINQSGLKTRDLLYRLSNGRLLTYYKGECYYVWWLRHSNNDDDKTNGVMEFATVRNNIYKVNVNSVYSLGGDIPGSEQLNAEVYVNKWVMLEGETLPM